MKQQLTHLPNSNVLQRGKDAPKRKQTRGNHGQNLAFRFSPAENHRGSFPTGVPRRLCGNRRGHTQLCYICCGRLFSSLASGKRGEWRVKRAPGRAPHHATTHAAAIGGCRRPGRGRFGPVRSPLSHKPAPKRAPNDPDRTASSIDRRCDE